MEGSGRVKKRKEIGGDGLPRRLRLLAMTWGGGEVGADSPWIPAGVGSVRRAAPTVWTGIGAYCPHVRKDLPPAGEGAPVRTLGRMREKAARAAAPESERLADTLPHLSQATSSPAGGGTESRRGLDPTVWTGIGAYCPHVRKDLPPAGEGAPVRTLGRMREKAARAAAPESERLADTLPHLSQATSSPAGGGTESRRGLDPTVWTGIGARNELRCMGEGKDPSTPLRFAQDDRSGAGKRLGAKR